MSQHGDEVDDFLAGDEEESGGEVDPASEQIADMVGDVLAKEKGDGKAKPKKKKKKKGEGKAKPKKKKKSKKLVSVDDDFVTGAWRAFFINIDPDRLHRIMSKTPERFHNKESQKVVRRQFVARRDLQAAETVRAIRGCFLGSFFILFFAQRPGRATISRRELRTLIVEANFGPSVETTSGQLVSRYLHQLIKSDKLEYKHLDFKRFEISNVAWTPYAQQFMRSHAMAHLLETNQAPQVTMAQYSADQLGITTRTTRIVDGVEIQETVDHRENRPGVVATVYCVKLHRSEKVLTESAEDMVAAEHERLALLAKRRHRQDVARLHAAEAGEDEDEDEDDDDDAHDDEDAHEDEDADEDDEDDDDDANADEVPAPPSDDDKQEEEQEFDVAKQQKKVQREMAVFEARQQQEIAERQQEAEERALARHKQGQEDEERALVLRKQREDIDAALALRKQQEEYQEHLALTLPAEGATDFAHFLPPDLVPVPTLEWDLMINYLLHLEIRVPHMMEVVDLSWLKEIRSIRVEYTCNFDTWSDRTRDMITKEVLERHPVGSVQFNICKVPFQEGIPYETEGKVQFATYVALPWKHFGQVNALVLERVRKSVDQDAGGCAMQVRFPDKSTASSSVKLVGFRKMITLPEPILDVDGQPLAPLVDSRPVSLLSERSRSIAVNLPEAPVACFLGGADAEREQVAYSALLKKHPAVIRAKAELDELVQVMESCPIPPTKLSTAALSVWRFPTNDEHREAFFLGVRAETDDESFVIFPYEDKGMQLIREPADMAKHFRQRGSMPVVYLRAMKREKEAASDSDVAVEGSRKRNKKKKKAGRPSKRSKKSNKA